MKKKNFVSLVMGTVGGILFALGMCMCMLPQWNAFTQGVVVLAQWFCWPCLLCAAKWKESPPSG